MIILKRSPNGSLGRLTPRTLATYASNQKRVMQDASLYHKRQDLPPNLLTAKDDWHTEQAHLDKVASETGLALERAMKLWRRDASLANSARVKITRLNFEAARDAARDHRVSPK